MKIKEKKRGFTLVEILAVIVLLASLTLIATGSIVAISNRTKIKMFCTKVETIEAAARQYGQDKMVTALPETPITITVADLRNEGYIKYDDGSTEVADPRDKASMLDKSIDVYRQYKRVYATYNYASEAEADLCGAGNN